MIGLALSSYFVLFGLLLGLLAVATYQNYSNVGDIVDKEASSMSALCRDFGVYPQPIRRQLQATLREYARCTIEEGWEQQRKGDPITAASSLGEVLGLGAVDEDEFYTALDWLLERQPQIEAALARRHLKDGTLVLYDVSSSYFEGRCCPLAQFGFNRDGKQLAALGRTVDRIKTLPVLLIVTSPGQKLPVGSAETAMARQRVRIVRDAEKQPALFLGQQLSTSHRLLLVPNRPRWTAALYWTHSVDGSAPAGRASAGRVQRTFVVSC